MGGIGGNVTAQVVRSVKGKNAQGIPLEKGTDPIMEITGWLDYQDGKAAHQAYEAKLQDTTHVFLSDYDEAFAKLSKAGLFLLVGGRRYEVLLIDDPMELHEHLETFLKHVGDA